MARFIGKIIALPVRLLAVILGWVKIFDPTKLWQAAWKLSRESDDGCKLLLFMCSKQVSEEARRTAEEIIAETKDGMPAAVIGMLEMQHNHDLEAAKKWIQFAEGNGCFNPEMLLYLRLLISAREGNEDENVINRILERNDLPGNFTRSALFSKAWKLAERKQWNEAEAIADKILEIEEQVDARFIKWMCCTIKGCEQEGQMNFRKAQELMPNNWFKIMAASGLLYMGNEGKAMEWLYKAKQDGLELRESRSPLGVLAHSEEFQRYCSEKSPQ